MSEPPRIARPPERDYSHRDVLDKLGLKSGRAIVIDEISGPLDPELRIRVAERAGRALADSREPVNVVLAVVDAATDLIGVLTDWKERLDPAGGIWLLTPKRRLPGYVPDVELIAAGRAAGLVDNKVCSVSDTTSGMRFVIRKADRPLGKG